MPDDSDLDKQAVVDAISDLLGIARDPLGPGSKEHKRLLGDIADCVGVAAMGDKHAVAKRIIEALGATWDRDCYSEGGSVQTEAFRRMLKALRARVGEQRSDFEIAVARLMASPEAERPPGNPRPQRVAGADSDFVRCPRVVAWVLGKSGRICGRCDRPAPFDRPNGRPYLEVHHVRPLAEGGGDTVDNAIALCPNCHREAHFGPEGRELRTQLERAVATREAS